MNRVKLFIFISFIVLLGCRTEEGLWEIERQVESSKKFVVFTKKDTSDVIDYADGFRALALRYDSLHSTNYTGRFLGDNIFEDVSYIEFGLRSEDIVGENGDRAIVFPRVKNGKVVGLMYGMLTESETRVSYGELDKNSEVYNRLFSAFDSVFSRLDVVNRYQSRVTDVGDVIIIKVVPRVGWGSYLIGVGGGDREGISGSCGEYQMCIVPDIGGGGSWDPPQESEPDPCEKMKIQVNNSNYKTKKSFLEGKLNNTSEFGFRVGLPVAGSGQVGPQYQQLSNKPGTSELDFRIFNTTIGIMHTHYDGLYPMFSPTDIYTFGQLLTNAQNHNIPLSDVFLSLVTSAGNYQLRFEGTHFTGWNQNFDFNQLTRNYKNYLGNSGNQEHYEKEFLKFMKDNMNIEGAKLIREGESSNTQLNLDQRGNLKTEDCK